MIVPTILTEDEWFDRFQPIKNHFGDRGYGHILFKIGDPDLAFIIHEIAEGRENTIWTLHDDGTIASGFHYVNRAGYFLCSVPVDDGATFEIPSEDDEE